jgi:hypothetical protein
MLMHATAAQSETFERLKELLGGKGILFTLAGSAACREYGLSRAANDLDFVVDPYERAMEILIASEEYQLVGIANPTDPTCTRRDTKTNVKVDFLKGGIRINDGTRPIGDARYRDPMPIPAPTGEGDVAPITTLIAMKLNSAIGGEETLKLGADTDGRSQEEIDKDISDVRELIMNHLGRRRRFGNKKIQRRYEKL